MWQRWQGYYLCILWRTLLNNKCVLVVYKNVCLKKGEVWQNFFLTQLQSRLSHKVCRLLFSAVLLWKFTIIGFPLQRVSQVWHTKLNPWHVEERSFCCYLIFTFSGLAGSVGSSTSSRSMIAPWDSSHCFP